MTRMRSLIEFSSGAGLVSHPVPRRRNASRIPFEFGIARSLPFSCIVQGRTMIPSDVQLSDLVEAATVASNHAYCPYSNFAVGAAVLTRDGSIFSGCNVENASFGLTICAERNAVFQAVAAGKPDIELVVVYTPTPAPTAPCGACRQVLNEFAPYAQVCCVCDGSARIEAELSELLPGAFGPSNLSE